MTELGALATINDYYSNDVQLVEVTQKDEALAMANSKASCSWGSGPIGDTGYTQLAAPSPQTKTTKQIVFYCKSELLK